VAALCDRSTLHLGSEQLTKYLQEVPTIPYFAGAKMTASDSMLSITGFNP